MGLTVNGAHRISGNSSLCRVEHVRQVSPDRHQATVSIGNNNSISKWNMECSNYISEKTTLEHQTRNEDNENKHSWTLRGAGRGVDLGGSGGRSPPW